MTPGGGSLDESKGVPLPPNTLTRNRGGLHSPWPEATPGRPSAAGTGRRAGFGANGSNAALIAQLVERVADNDEVSGSSPDGPSGHYPAERKDLETISKVWHRHLACVFHRRVAHRFSGGGAESAASSSPPPLKRWATRPPRPGGAEDGSPRVWCIKMHPIHERLSPVKGELSALDAARADLMRFCTPWKGG